MSRISSFTDTTGFSSPHSSCAGVGAGGGGVREEHAETMRTVAHVTEKTAHAVEPGDRKKDM